MRMIVAACVLMALQFGDAGAQNEASFGISVEPKVARVGAVVEMP